jgi:hypothetical protein
MPDALNRLAAVAALLAGCVKEPTQIPVDAQIGCLMNTDCALGEECRSGTCFGGPEGVEFAAELIPPDSRKGDLAPAEITKLEVSRTGVVNVKFAPSVLVTGRVLLHSNDALSSAAQVQFHRASRINGAPDYTVTVDAQYGTARGEAAFRTPLPPNIGDEHYDLTIRPDDGTIHALPLGTPPPNALAPPFYSPFLQLTKDFNKDIPIDANLRPLSGKVLDAAGQPISGMRVRAWGRTTLAALAPISSQGTTDDSGAFTFWLPQPLSGVFTVRVTPGPDAKKNQASLERKDVTPGIGATSLPDDITYPALPATASYNLPVAGGGNQSAVGASVTFTATLLADGSDTVTFSATSTVSAGGVATVDLVPATYAVAVHPPPTPDQTSGELWSIPVLVGAEQLTLPALTLPARVSVTGKIVDADGMPAANMTIRARPSPRFLARLTSDDDRARVTALPVTEALPTDKDNGTFKIYLDSQLAGTPVIYDLEIVPPSGSHLPRAAIDDGVTMTTDAGNIDIGTTMLKKAALASGMVTDPDNHPVVGAELRVYERIANAPAKLRAVVESDKTGQVLLVLPSP